MAAPGIKAVIFDCFGVLYVDHKTSLLAQVPFEKQKDLADVFMSNNYGYFGREDYLARVAAITGMTVAEVSNYIAHEHRINSPLVTLITEQLRPHYKIGLLSNIGRDWINDFFTKHQLHDYFDEVVLSGEEGITKPDPSIFALTASRLGVDPSECLMIDDIKENCDGAEMAGMYAIHYQTNEQLLEELYRLGVL